MITCHIWLHFPFDQNVVFLELKLFIFYAFLTFDQVVRNVTLAASCWTNQKTHVNSTRLLVKLIKFIVKTKWEISLIAWKAMDYCSACFHCDLALFKKLHLSLRSGKCNTFIFSQTKIFKNGEQSNMIKFLQTIILHGNGIITFFLVGKWSQYHNIQVCKWIYYIFLGAVMLIWTNVVVTICFVAWRTYKMTLKYWKMKAVVPKKESHIILYEKLKTFKKNSNLPIT